MKKVKVVGGRKMGAATAPTDLLVCFPGRQHLALMPKSICSPSRATLDRAVAARRRQLQLPAARSLPSGGGGGAGGRGRGSSPLFRGSKAKQPVEDDDEPQSPKVTCAGHIKVVRPRKPKPVVVEQNGRCSGVGGSGKRWITVAEEIERLQEQRKKVSWLEAFGIRRDALPFLGGALRSLRHKVRCFGSSLHAPVDSSTDDDDDDDAGEHERESGAATSVFSKWLMVLERSQEPQVQDSRDHDDDNDERPSREARDDCSKLPSVPPANALLLMRCRSAPAKGLARKGAEEPTDGEETAHEKGSAEEDRDDMVFMRTAPDFLKLSIDIAKETWVVGGVDALARSRSWKR
ncbi:unnamed protein product [Alopecurus aequalis]